MLQRAQNFFERIINILENLFIPEAHNDPALLIEKCVSCRIADLLSIISMLSAVEFNDHTSLDACKVRNVRTHGVLSPKSIAAELSIADA